MKAFVIYAYKIILKEARVTFLLSKNLVDISLELQIVPLIDHIYKSF